MALQVRVRVHGAAGSSRDGYAQLPATAVGTAPPVYAALARSLSQQWPALRTHCSAQEGLAPGDYQSSSNTGLVLRSWRRDGHPAINPQSVIPAAFAGGGALLELFLEDVDLTRSQLTSSNLSASLNQGGRSRATSSEDAEASVSETSQGKGEVSPLLVHVQKTKQGSEPLQQRPAGSTKKAGGLVAAARAAKTVRGILKTDSKGGSGRRLSWTGVTVLGEDPNKSFESIEEAERRQQERAAEEERLEAMAAAAMDADLDEELDVDALLNDIDFSTSEDDEDDE